MAKVARSMDRALDLTPEMSAFIRGESHSAETAPKRMRATDPVAPAAKSKRAKGSRAKSKSPATDSVLSERVVRPVDDATLPAGILVPVTTRLRLETANALRRACLEQKLERKSPSTQQEILESAVRAWLVGTGYLAE